jgi:hypothetical protein
MSLDTNNFIELETLSAITVADSFVLKANKIGTAAGEAKLYVGHDSSVIWNFFGEPGFQISCFIKKVDLLTLLIDLKSEYFNPKQKYRNTDCNLLRDVWYKRYEKIQAFEEITWFECFEQGQIRGDRVYLKSSSDSYKLLREISLPNLTLISIKKFKDQFGHNYYGIIPYSNIRSS